MVYDSAHVSIQRFRSYSFHKILFGIISTLGRCHIAFLLLLSTMNIQSLIGESIPIRAREGSFDSAEDRTDTQAERREELAQMAKGLRRMKRQLFLHHVEDSHKPGDSLRDILMKAAYGGSVGSPPCSPRPQRHLTTSAPSSPSARTDE